MRLLAAVAAIVALAGPARADDELAVVALGEDAAAAGAVQHAVASRLAARRVVVPADLVVERLGLAGAAPASERADGAIERAKEAFYKNRLDDALRELDDADASLVTSDPARRAVRVRSRLWRTATLLAQHREDDARAAVEAALAIDPRLVVDLALFWPSLAEFVDKVRGGRTTFAVSIAETPRSARILVDGLAVERDFAVRPGIHRIAVEAPGYRTVERTVDVTAAMRLSLPLAIATTAGALTRAKLGARLVTLELRGDAVTAGLAGRKSPAFSRDEPDRVVAWVLGELAPAAPVAALVRSAALGIATVVGTRTASSPAAEVTHQGIGVRLDLGGELAYRIAGAWSIAGAARLEGTLFGAGDIAVRNIAPPSQTRARLGTTGVAELSGAIRRAIASDRLVLGAHLATVVGRVGSRDLDAMRVFEPATFLSLDAAFAVGVRLGPIRAHVALRTSIVMVPLAGAQPNRADALAGELGYRRGSWDLALALAQGNRGFDTGAAAAPELRDGQRTEEATVIGLRATRRL